MRYRIVVRGEISRPFVGPLEGVVVEKVDDESTLVVEVVDQAHLHGVLRSLEDRRIEVVSLNQASG